MKAAVWDGSDILKFDPDYPDPVCRDDWVVIKVMSAGICATDLHIMRGEFGEPPLIMGHEICGIITDIGSRVESCGVGDRVVVETAVSCGHCRYCESGQKHLCSECHEVGFPPHNGGYAQYVTAPANCIHRIPDSMSWDEGGVLEAALCPFGLICRYGVKPGETVLIQGTGVAGLSFLQSVKALGAGKVIVAARNPYRLEQALRFGADTAINTKTENLYDRVMEETGGLGADLSIDSAGAPVTIEQAVKLAAPGGRCILYGLPDGDPDIHFPVKEIIMKQLTVMGGTNNQLAWDPLIELIAEGRFDVKSYVTGHCTLETVNEAVREVRAHPDHLIKTVIHPWE
ncbi:MAG: alcohol dehydrogenase catalytic domain-containing protein [Lachnospiraceae bacterium]|nr:alcohol dehydrogenase catalytic domain-containing protein [Lachnospiraceae bacterium]